MVADIIFNHETKAIDRKVSRSGDVIESIIVTILFLILALCFQKFLGNLNIATTNGLWKSIDVAIWQQDPDWSRVDFANVLYFPVQSVFCRLLDRLGIYTGQTWRQIALINPLFGALGAGASYLFVKRWMGSRFLAIASALFYCGGAFYMLLSLISEDDMPNSVLILLTTLLACAWFSRATYIRIAVVAFVFSLAWLWEWRVLFPSLPPLLFSLFIVPGQWEQRLLRPAVFAVAMAGLPAAITGCYFLLQPDIGIQDARDFFVQLFWAGKGVGTGWGGWSAQKIPLYWGGLFESLLGGRNSTDPLLWTRQVKSEAIVGTTILLILGGLALRYAWRHRREWQILVSFIILAGTFAAGTVFNIYSQPQDPQMVINIMMWTLPAGAIVLHAIIARFKVRLGKSAVLSPAVRTLVVMIALVPLLYNSFVFAEFRGEDSKQIETVARLATHFDPQKTVYLYHGFDGIITWQTVLQGGHGDLSEDLPPALNARGSFKIINVTDIPIQQKSLSPKQIAEKWNGKIEGVFDKGYRVVAAPSMLVPQDQWRASFVTFATPEVADAIRSIFEKNYTVHEVYRDPMAGHYYEVERRQK